MTLTTTTIYQAVSNGYDKPRPPKSLCDHVDYTIVAGTACKDRGPMWNRFHKILGAPLLCDFSVYMDGNIGLNVEACHLHAWVEEVLKDADLAICRHNDRRCAFVEVEACVGRKKITDRQARKAHEHLLANGLPRNFGLWECGIIIRRSDASWVEDLCSKWFDHLIETNVPRDQLWLPLALHQMRPNIPAGRFKTLEMNVRKNDFFTFGAHA